ncbi:MAG: 3-methyl-2-oxobutanoate hydroxymethyltransferase [bacterium]|nr:3-methyl-2-oxobutanoate hydroxymethyltransferase [bacterium]
MTKRKTIVDIKNLKNKEKITALTCYSFFNAKILDLSKIDLVLIGDSLGNVILGYEDTLAVEVEDIIYHARVVQRGNKTSLLVADMPFMSYQATITDALKNAGDLVKYGKVNAVKLEGGVAICDKVRAIIEIGIPVIGHLGLTPQSVNAMGGYKIQAKKEKEQKKLIEDALALQKAGAFAIVLECIPSDLAANVTKHLDIPTIGIGAGKCCDGQILVLEDMLGLNFEKPNSFVKEYSKGKELFLDAVKNYARDVKGLKFP